MTIAAKKPHESGSGEMHDHTYLDDILLGIDDIFGCDTHAGVILYLVALHQSLPSLNEYPPAAPLDDHHIKQYISHDFLRLMEPLMLADSASYQMCHEQDRTKYLGEIRENLNLVRDFLDDRVSSAHRTHSHCLNQAEEKEQQLDTSTHTHTHSSCLHRSESDHDADHAGDGDSLTDSIAEATEVGPTDILP
jgi:hypothetical protein